MFVRKHDILSNISFYSVGTGISRLKGGPILERRWAVSLLVESTQFLGAFTVKGRLRLERRLAVSLLVKNTQYLRGDSDWGAKGGQFNGQIYSTTEVKIRYAANGLEAPWP